MKLLNMKTLNMKTLNILGATALLGIAAVPASAADLTGAVNVTGFVAASCTAGGVISGSIPLGDLAKADGTVNNALSGSASFKVSCSGAAPKFTLTATPMGNGGAAAPAGYANSVDYDAHLTFTLADTSQPSFACSTANVAACPTSPTAIGGPLATPTTDNLVVSVNNLTTANTGDILVAGNYGAAVGGAGGVISITVANN
jgi:hypothetical protein